MTEEERKIELEGLRELVTGLQEAQASTDKLYTQNKNLTDYLEKRVVQLGSVHTQDLMRIANLKTETKRLRESKKRKRVISLELQIEDLNNLVVQKDELIKGLQRDLTQAMRVGGME